MSQIYCGRFHGGTVNGRATEVFERLFGSLSEKVRKDALSASSLTEQLLQHKIFVSISSLPWVASITTTPQSAFSLID